MRFKDVIEFLEKIEGADDDDDFNDDINDVGDYFNKRGEEGTRIVLSKMKEEDFVKIVRAAKASLLVTLNDKGLGMSLLVADKIEGDLDAYTHTVILNILGVLAETEVI